MKEKKIFFDYKITREKHSNKKYIDLNAGIDINPKAMQFFKKYNIVLKKAVNLEWAKFLEKLNLGVPRLIQKTEGELIPRTALGKYRKALEPYFKNCFYCEKHLLQKEIHVDHVIPFDYIAEDSIWNFTLACQKCNCVKSGSLPPEKYIVKLIERNKNYRDKISMLEKSLTLLGMNFEKVIHDHFENAMMQGYVVLKKIL
ncbi:HNH endonuclease [Candidatus Nitrosopumilus salaria]|uniref:HNH endonuclease n=1 Tax=Candidatus Nitrosopumilus salarius TaxID=1170320 RepID=UPI00131537FF|nr:HNH endonuclease signature motif containing protein [Candidatus Nitrosopumilus salaria]